MGKKKSFGFVALAGFTMAVILVVSLMAIFRTNYRVGQDLVFEINSEVNVSELFESIDGELVSNGKINTSNLGENTVTALLGGPFGTQKAIEIRYIVVDTIAPMIEGEDEFEIFRNGDLDVAKHYDIRDNSNGDITSEVEGDCDTTVIGVCEVRIIARDQSGNETLRDVTINVVADPAELSQNVAESAPRLSQSKYYIKVNRLRNVVMVYAQDENGKYTRLVKTFVSSTGKTGSETPLGVFTVSDRYEALFLVGEVWGHYAVRISGPYFFHSVPYFSKGNPDWDDLEYLEYNKLGEGASAGCVRLAARDAKWIYDNVEMGTTVEIYDGELPDGAVKPEAIRIDLNDERRGWDPTDPDVANPWNE